MSMTATASQPMMKGMSDRSSAPAWNHRALGKPVAVSLLLHATVFASLFAWWHAQGAPAPRGLPDGFSVTFIELSDPSLAPAAPQVPQEMQAAPVEPQPQIEPEPIVAPAIPVKPEVALEARPEPRPEARAALVRPAAPQQTASLAPAAATGTGQGTPKGLKETSGQSTDEILVLNPRYRDRPRPPRYPDRARSLNQEGIVKVRIKLDHRGDPMDVAVLASSGYALLDHAALMAARKWRFEPEIRNGRPVIAFVEMPVEFVLTDSR